jgi:hypothetical protein
LAIQESDLVLRPLNCKIGGMEPICILQPDHPCCEDVPRQEIMFEGGQLVKQGNSAIVSLKLHFNDPVEQFIFERIRNELFRNPGPRVKVIREPEEGYEISFFLNTEMVGTMEQRETLIKYWTDFSIKMRQVLTDGKMVINKFVRSRADSCRIK